jgi:uncharacterized membrane protein
MRRIGFGLLAWVAATAFSAWAYSRLPARVVTHWGLNGQPNGWSSRAFAVALMPAMMLALLLVFQALPRIDPLRRNYELHGGTYWTVVNAVFAVLAGVHLLTLGVNLGWPIRIETWVPLAVGLLFVVIGNLMSRMRPNWFMGIRTPWTLSSENVWRKTHRLGGYLFVAAGFVVAALGLVRAPWALAVLIGVALLAALIPVVYSYVLWRREQTQSA